MAEQAPGRAMELWFYQEPSSEVLRQLIPIFAKNDMSLMYRSKAPHRYLSVSRIGDQAFVHLSVVVNGTMMDDRFEIYHNDPDRFNLKAMAYFKYYFSHSNLLDFMEDGKMNRHKLVLASMEYFNEG